MPAYDYAIATGFNVANGSLTNLETIFTVNTMPRGLRVPLGAVSRKALSGKRRTDGAQEVVIILDACTFEELEDYVTLIFGNWDTENANVTIKLRDRDNTFTRYNAIAYLPLDGTDYKHHGTKDVEDVQLRFFIIGEAS